MLACVNYWQSWEGKSLRIPDSTQDNSSESLMKYKEKSWL